MIQPLTSVHGIRLQLAWSKTTSNAHRRVSGHQHEPFHSTYSLPLHCITC